MQDKYIQKYNNDDKKPTKVVCLGVCILLDLIVLAGIIACFSTKKYLDLIIYASIFIIALAIRIATLYFTYKIVIGFDDGKITIIKKYPHKEIVLYEGLASQLKMQKCNDLSAKNSKKYVRLCPKSCECDAYMVEFNKRRYMIYLDDYLFSLIEVKSDLS